MQAIHCIDITKSLYFACSLHIKNNKTQTNKKDKTDKLEKDKQGEVASKTCGKYLCKTI